MSERIIGLTGELVDSIEFGDDPDSTEFCAYRITIKTSERTLVIKGCHDTGPNLTETPA